MLKALLLLPLALASVCPKYKCSDDVPEGACVQFSTSEIYLVNTSPCPDTAPYCNLVTVKDWVQTAFVNNTYACEVTNTTDYWTEPGTDDYLVCQKKSYDKDLASGSHPKECSTAGWADTDCSLVDGTISECRCGLNGKSYCLPDISSSAFDDYWTQCCDVGCGHLDSFEHYLFWYLKQTYFVDYISGYSCSKIFSQLKDIDTLDYIGSGAAELAIGLAALTLL